MAHLNISLLGHFEVTLDDRPLTGFGTDKVRALLAYLVVEADRAHRREMLAGLLWPEVSEEAAHHNLSQALLLLRKALDEKTAAVPFLLAGWRTLRFNPASDTTLDVAAFQAGVEVCRHCPPEQLSPTNAQALAQAVESYQGEFLSTPLQINSEAFEEWLRAKQTQLHMLALDGLGLLVQYHEFHGEFALAADYARRQIALEPLLETAHRQLIWALALDGRGPEALAHYAACKTLLAQELGIQPAPETTALYERIRAARGTPPLSMIGDRPQRGEKLGTGPLVPPPPFVGRARELARLDDALALALADQGQGVFVTGEAGSGKTTLLDAFARRALAAHPDVLVVNSSGNAYTGLGDPYWPFIEMLRQLRGGTTSVAVLSRLQAQHLEAARPAITPALATFGPDLEGFLSAGGLTVKEPGLRQSHLFDRITRTLRAVASRAPLVLLLDDLQWTDRGSLDLLFHLGRHLAGLRLLIVGAFRPDALYQSYSPSASTFRQDTGQPNPLATLFNELQRYLGDIRIDLAQAEGQTFIDALLDSEPNRLGREFRETLYRHTGGHALFTTELLRGMQERGDLVCDAHGYWGEGAAISWQALPARVEGVIAERIGQLLPDWQAMLAVASVEGDEFTVQVLARTLDLDEAEVIRRLSGPLTRHHALVVPLGVQQVGPHSLARYRFRHLLFQKYLYNRLDPVERAQLHLTVGYALEALYEGHAAEISLSLVRHFELGGEADKAIAYLLQAGWRATQLAAAEEALRLLTRGLALLKRLERTPEREQQEAELQLALGTALLAKGWSAPERAQAIERAYDLCQRAGDAGQVARSLLMLADVDLARGQFSQAVALGEQLRDLAQATQDGLAATLAHYVLGSAYFFMGQMLQARCHLEQAIALYDPQTCVPATLTSVDMSVGSRVWLAETLWVLGYADQAVACSRQAIASARELDRAFSLGFALGIGELSVRHSRREPQALRVALQQLAALGHDASLSIFQFRATLFQGWLAAVERQGRFDLSQMEQAIRQWEASGTQGGRAQHRLLLAEAYRATGQVESAFMTVEQSLAQIVVTGNCFFKAELLRLKGELCRQLARPVEAEACFLKAIAVAQDQAAKAWELRAVMSLCRLRQAEGAPDRLEQTRCQLAELYAWFTEGLDTPDLQEAAALLADTGCK